MSRVGDAPAVFRSDVVLTATGHAVKAADPRFDASTATMIQDQTAADRFAAFLTDESPFADDAA